MLDPAVGYSEARKEEILRAYQERLSLRGISRTFGVSRPTVAAWLKKLRRLPKVADGLAEAQPDDILELDEVCGYVQKRRNKVCNVQLKPDIFLDSLPIKIPFILQRGLIT